jgi:hypothetical protein
LSRNSFFVDALKRKYPIVEIEDMAETFARKYFAFRAVIWVPILKVGRFL